MSTTNLLAAAGLLLALGLVVAVKSLYPAPPALNDALAQLSATPAPACLEPARARRRWMPQALRHFLQRWVTVAPEDLRLVGWSREDLAARCFTLGLVGLLFPSLLTAVAVLMRVSVPVVVPGIAGVVLAVVLWRLPIGEVREDAEAVRAQFRSALASYLDLVALERVARGSIQEALDCAAEVSGSEPFVQVRAALARAALAGQPPWESLRQLGDLFGVEELRNLGAMAQVAADGGSVYKTLLAESRSLRHAELTRAREQANKASERMSVPVALLTIGMLLFVFIPFGLRLFGEM